MKKLNFLFNKFDLDRDLMILLIIGGLYSLAISLSNTFVNIYLWKQSGDYVTIAVYNLGIFVFQPLTFFVAGKLSKTIDRIKVLRLGIIFLSLFYLTVLIIGEHASTFNFLIGSLLGIGYGFYWLAFDVLTFEITEPETRDFFNGFFGGLQSLAGMIGPMSAGIIISTLQTNIGYTFIFSLSFVLFILAILCSFFVPHRKARGYFHIKKIVKERFENPNWHNILKAHFFQGLREGFFFFVITIWVYLVTQSEFSLGLFNLLLSLFSFIFYFVTIRLIKPMIRKKAILLGAFLLYLPILIIIPNKSFIFLLIYAVLIGIAYPIINVPYYSMTFDVIGQGKYAKKLRIEYIVIKELVVNIGRIVSIIVFLISLTFFTADIVIPILLLTFGLSPFIVYLYIRDVHLKSNPEG